jgi:23S rRNA pseudouridine1911/1915/1917 synthase
MTDKSAKKLTLVVTEDQSGRRLDQVLVSADPELSRTRVQGLIDQGLVRVDGSGAKASVKVKAGQVVTLVVPAVAPSDLLPDATVCFDIIYQDEDLLVINKPPGLVVHPAAGHETGTLVHGLLAACHDLAGIGGEARPGIVHRLDKDTSGLMIVAKNEAAHKALVEMFKERQVGKIYLALTLGWPKGDRGDIELPIGRHPVRRKEMSTRSTSGRPALTRYQVLGRFAPGLGYLKLKIMTGRTHQIRVHLAALGFPVLGDAVYGKGLGVLKHGGGAIRDLVNRQMLHAHRLVLAHPCRGGRLEFEAPLPPDMALVLETLEHGADS